VKAGSGAFLPAEADALTLAQTMIALGESSGVRTVALVTAMDRPLGHACGNALEVEEGIMALRGEGPRDLMEVSLALGAELLTAAGLERDASAGRKRLLDTIASGAASRKFAEIIEAQGGNPAIVDDPAALPQAEASAVYVAPASGRVAAVHPKAVGLGVNAMGGGRTRVEDQVDPSVGFVITVRPGDSVVAGQPVATIYAGDTAGLRAGEAALSEAIVIGGKAPPPRPLVSHRVTREGVEVLPHQA